MNGKKYALILSFLCWLSVIVVNWLQLLSMLEYDGVRTALHVIVFVIIGAFAGTIAGSNK